VAAGPGGTTLTYRATAKVPRSLRSGTHAVDVTVTGGRLTVAVDGARLLNVTPPRGFPAGHRLALRPQRR
jgi:hypothetical protein